MKKVCPKAQLGQGSDPSPARAGHPPAPFLDALPVPSEARPAEAEAARGEARGAHAPAEAVSSLLQERGSPLLQPPPHLPVEPRAGQGQEEAVLHSLARRAARAVRPFVQSAPRHELWVMGFDQDCGQVGLQRLVPGEQGQPFAFLLTVLAWAVAMGARAIVLVQNRPGPHRLSTPLDIVPTLKLAAAANLFGITLVDHLVILSGGRSPLSLRQRRTLPAATALAAQLETSLEALATEQCSFGVSAEAAEAPEAAEALEAPTKPTLP